MGTAYATEIFIAWYSGSQYEFFVFFQTGSQENMLSNFGQWLFATPLYLNFSGLRK
jgi:hypothetical protein